MRPYHPANFKLTPYPGWKLRILAWVGAALDMQFHINGIPFGGSYKGPKGEAYRGAIRTIRRKHPLARVFDGPSR